MAIFVALIFQVLFVFFAMAINLALVVHDKINLQNAVDLAAYYAAAKQAQILDVIAHTNYQIHQAWKLLNFRYYYLGNMGRLQPFYTGGPPYFPGDPPYPNVPPTPYSDNKRYWGRTPPPLCVVYPLWSNVGTDDLCKSAKFSFKNIPIPPFPSILSVIVPAAGIYKDLAKSINGQIQNTAGDYSAYNWWFAATIMVSFAEEQKERRKVIRALANELSLPIQPGSSGMIDITDPTGRSVYRGAYKTFLKNLTGTNRDSFLQEEKQNNQNAFQIYNGLQNIPGGSQAWLPATKVYFMLQYQNFKGTGHNITSNVRPVLLLPTWPSAIKVLDARFGKQAVQELQTYIQQLSNPSPSNPNNLAIGVEKNPWDWAYVAVSAQTKPRQLFSPFSKPVTFKAVAYAMPFGGTIGPWYGTEWQSGQSAQGSSGSPLDVNEPPRLGSSTGTPTYNELLSMAPNYSRYPGDTQGAASALWNQSFVGIHNNMFPASLRANFTDYVGVTSFGSGQTNDGLAWQYNHGSPSSVPSVLRPYEIASLAPDLFDITYYSIQPNFPQRYLADLQDNASRLGLSPGAIFGDMGSRNGTNYSTLSQFSVIDQVNVANGRESVLGAGQSTPQSIMTLPQGSSLYNPRASWYITDPYNVLTSWVGNYDYADYSFPTGRFGKCQTKSYGLHGSPKFSSAIGRAAPDACVSNGGRSGYSVKIVSKQIFSESLPLGGGGSSSTINNPPPF